MPKSGTCCRQSLLLSPALLSPRYRPLFPLYEFTFVYKVRDLTQHLLSMETDTFDF